MLYTGTCLAEEGKIQRIGLASSRDLVCWEKHLGNPVIEVDPRWYEDKPAPLLGECAWRDPYVIFHKPDNTYYTFITARAITGPSEGRGCIALAHSIDLKNWEVLPPVTSPGVFLQMEVPQFVFHAERKYLLFSLDKAWLTDGGATRLGTQAVTGTYYMVSRRLRGGYSWARLLLGGKPVTNYAAKLVRGLDGAWKVLSWLGYDQNGEFIGGLSDPRPVHFLLDGTMEVE